ncbi:unnamed protein product [Pseudo-nitzschia multistriata]|uniref:Trigger factor ribosome-binding bacterial domain-containing protein n=1 Tax=Pseudo-nitzschia multistriata TaxID=183589 RepID=A0A448ZH70_9STRA|nr:unnamed protein product [Pseudo-nitzschia multistriata]
MEQTKQGKRCRTSAKHRFATSLDQKWFKITTSAMNIFSILVVFMCVAHQSAAFSTGGIPTTGSTRVRQSNLCSSIGGANAGEEWNGEVVSSGTIRGCIVTQVGESVTEWVIQIDGVEADLGRFSEAIYKQITNDAKRQSFQGFRAGTIPPQLLKTYRAYAMDECARETVLEAMQQNNIRPFTNAREEIRIEEVSIPPPKQKGKKKKKKKKSKKAFGGVESSEPTAAVAEEPPAEPEWKLFESMDLAISAGWAPGQSFSFIATNVKGQKVVPDDKAEQAFPLGARR